MKKELKNTLRVERARHRLTQERLASMANISRTQLFNMENGKVDPGITICLRIVECLNKLKIDTGMNVINLEDIFKLT